MAGSSNSRKRTPTALGMTLIVVVQAIDGRRPILMIAISSVRAGPPPPIRGNGYARLQRVEVRQVKYDLRWVRRCIYYSGRGL